MGKAFNQIKKIIKINFPFDLGAVADAADLTHTGCG